MRNVNASEVVEQFFKRDIPVIVEDGLRDWEDVIVQSPRAVADVSSLSRSCVRLRPRPCLSPTSLSLSPFRCGLQFRLCRFPCRRPCLSPRSPSLS